MAGFVFRLQSFLGVKEKIEDQKRVEYGKSMAKLNEEKQKLSLMESELANVVLSLKNALSERINSNDIRNRNNYINDLKIRIEQQKEKVTRAKRASDKKRDELVEAMKERKMLETLKEHDKEAYMKEQLYKEQKVTDEIVSYKYSTRN